MGLSPSSTGNFVHANTNARGAQFPISPTHAYLRLTHVYMCMYIYINTYVHRISHKTPKTFVRDFRYFNRVRDAVHGSLRARSFGESPTSIRSINIIPVIRSRRAVNTSCREN